MPKPIPQDKRDAILADVNAGDLSRAAIGRKHEVSGWTVGNIAREAGLINAFSRESTKNATRARVADSAERRARIAADLLDDVEFLRAKFRQDWTKTVVVPGVGASTVEADSAEIATGLQRLMTSVGIALDKHIALEKHDAGDDGVAGAVSTIEQIMGALRGNAGD